MKICIRAILDKLASLWLTLICVVVAAAFAATSQMFDRPVTSWMAVPFVLLFFNLVAAMVASTKMRRQVWLLGFHLALAVLALLIAADRLVAMSGHVEVTVGAPFDADLVKGEAGPLHRWNLDQIDFVQGDFVINYAPRMKRRETHSRVHLRGVGGSWRTVIVGDDVPLVASGYRFYTSFNKGYAPVVTFTNSSGESFTGAIHLPSYPLNYYKQGNEWTPPGSVKTIKVWLQLSEPVYLKNDPWMFRKPADAVLVIMNGDQRQEMRLGDQLSYSEGGRLHYDDLRLWMGYTISYNPLTPWMAATVIVAVLCLVGHIAWKFTRYSWLDAGGKNERNYD